MPFENLPGQSQQAREISKRFQEAAFQQRHHIAKRDSEQTLPPRKDDDFLFAQNLEDDEYH
jgi:hypothetical protein